MSDRGESLAVVGVNDEAGHLVGFVGNDMLGKECGKGQIGESILGGNLLLACHGGNTGQLIAAASRRGLGEECLEIAERITAVSNRRAVHRSPRKDWVTPPSCSESSDTACWRVKRLSNECRQRVPASSGGIRDQHFGRFPP